MTTTAAAKVSAPHELTITRIIDAPRAVVFKMWIDPKHLAQWWGPQGFTNPRCELDARAGGKIRIDMRGPDGTIYPMSGAFREIAPPERLAFTSVAEDRSGAAQIEAITTVTFEDVGGKTRLTMRATAVAKTTLGEQYLQGMNAGWNGSLDRLTELVAREA